MRWIILSAFVIINVIRGSPIDKELHNTEIVENKFLTSNKVAPNSNFNDQLSYRLPTETTPVSYDIYLTTNIHNGDKNFTGIVKIQIRILKATDVVTLHYRQIKINKIDIFDTSDILIRANAGFDYIESHDFLIINLPQRFIEGAELVLYIEYNGELRDDGQGFYWGSYTNKDGILKYYGATQFEVDDARHAVPCYDEPGIRATMKLTITHDRSYSAIANMDIENQVPAGNNFITYFKTSPRMQSYLLAFAISDYGFVNATVNTRIPQKVYAIPRAIESGEANYAATVVGNVLAKFEEILGVEYPLDKMDHIALTKFNFGAMENFGLITYIDRGLMLDPTGSESYKFSQENSVVALIAHEYAHQWFGNIVSPQWWQYTWLNEGFATIFANYVPELLYPGRNFMRRYFTSTMPTAFNSDIMDSWAMNHYTEQPSELWDKFGGIGYQKSGCVIRMFMEVLTTDVFFNGLNIYLRNNYMKAATPEELHAGFQEAYNQANPQNSLNISQLMGTWENQPGYPLVTVSISGNNLLFSQRRYPEGKGEIYSVPITLATKTNSEILKTPKTWLHTQSMSVAQSSIQFNPNDWIVVNIEQVGYYRVDYDTTLWKAIIKQLNDNPAVIGPINRALLQEEFNMAWTNFNRVNGADALEILNYFDKESESIAWQRAQRNLNILNDRLFGTNAHEKFNEFLKKITKPHRETLGHSGFDGEDPDLASLRSYTKQWSCQAFDDDCLLKEYDMFKKFLSGSNIIDFSLCSAMRLIEEEIFSRELNNTLMDESYAYRFDFVRTFGCSIIQANQYKLLQAILDETNNLAMSERHRMLRSLFESSVLGMETTLKFINEHPKELSTTIDLYEMMYYAAYKINGDPLLSTFTTLLNKLRSESYITEEEKQIVMTEIARNNKWLDENYSNILMYFGIQVSTTTGLPTTTPPFTTTQGVITTTPDSAHSIVISAGLIAISLIINLL